MEHRSFHQNSRQNLSKYGLNYSLAWCSNIVVDGKSKILGKSPPETGRFARMKATGIINTKNGCGSLVGSMHDRCWPKYCSHHRCPIYRTLVHKGLSNFSTREGSTFFKWKLVSFMDKKCSGLMLACSTGIFEARFGPIAAKCLFK